MSVRLISLFLIFITLWGGDLFGNDRKRLNKAKTLHSEIDYNLRQKWTELAKTEKKAIQALVQLLERSKTGRKVLNRARRKAAKDGLKLSDVILAGNGSLTDTTLIRKFYPSQPDHVIYESRSKVFVNRRLSVRDALLDMAHELVHYSFRMPFNPYQGTFSLKDFVTSTVEGKGGEVEAYLIECKVFFELFPKDKDSNCHKVVEPGSGKLSKKKGVQQFYRVGRHYRHFRRNLSRFDLSLQDFPKLSSSDALFISSAYGLPYPLAAIKEYKTIMSKACQNDQKRLGLLRQQLSNQPREKRSPARQNLYYDLTESYKTRCQKFPSS